MARLVLVRMPGQMPLWAAPVFHWPPRSPEASNTVVSKPASSACLAKASPLGPAPITAIRPPEGSIAAHANPYPVARKGVGCSPRGNNPCAWPNVSHGCSRSASSPLS